MKGKIMEPKVIPAIEIRTGDQFEKNENLYNVTFAALLRGINVEIKYKSAALPARMTPEERMVVTKNTPIKVTRR
jgi:hypothetical protein